MERACYILITCMTLGVSIMSSAHTSDLISMLYMTICFQVAGCFTTIACRACGWFESKSIVFMSIVEHPLWFVEVESSFVPRFPRPAFVACSMKSGERPGRIYHVMCATADVMFSLLTFGFSPLDSSFPEFSLFFLFSLSCESHCYWIDHGKLQYVMSAAAYII